MQHKYSNDNPGKIGNYFIFSFHTFFLILKRLSINTLVHATLFKTTLAHTAKFNEFFFSQIDQTLENT